MPHHNQPYIPPAADPIVAVEHSLDPFRRPLGDLFKEQAELRLALARRVPGRATRLRRLAAVEAALTRGGGR